MDPLDAKDIIEQVTFKRPQTTVRAIAVFTSLFALFASISALMSGRCSTRGIIAKNENIYFQGLATDEWSFFQSRNMRGEMYSILSEIKKTSKATLEEEQKRFKKEADISYNKAKQFETQRDHWNQISQQYLDVSKSFASALAFFQTAVVLVPLTLIAESILVFAVGNALGLIGFVFLTISYWQYFHFL